MGTSSMSRSPLLEYLEALSLPVLVLSNSGIDLSPILANFALQRITEGADFLSCLLPGEGEKLSRWIVEERWRELGDEVEIIISSSSSARSGRRLRSTDRKSIHTRWKVMRSHDLGQDIIIFTGTTNDFKPRLDLSSIPSFTSLSSNPMSFPSPLLTPSDELVLTPTERFKELELLLDLCSVGVARLDLSGKLIWVNRAWRDVADHPIDLPLEDWPKNIDERDVQGLTTEWAYCVKNLVRLDYQFRVKSGKVVLAHVTPNHADPALITGWISNLIDVTKRVKGEEAVTALALERVMAVRQQEAVEHAEARRRDAEQQRQQQEQLIDIVSHEIRNPISAIMQNSELTHASLVRLRKTLATTLQMDCCGLPSGLSTNTLTQLDEDIESLESISECAMAQERIANDILGLAQIQLGKYCIARTYFRIASSLNSTLRMFHSECRAKDIVLRLELGSTLERLGSPPMLSGDPVRLSQIIINLISNALRFTADSPTREVTLQVDVSYLASIEGEPLLVPDDSEFLPHADSPLYFYFSVSDSGQGMTEEQTGRIFERFMQASPFTHHMGGSGLGLWISRNLCELHGGKIEVVSSVGVGSTFRGYVLAGPIKPQFPSPLSPASTSISLAPTAPSAENGHHVNSSTTVSSGITYPMLRILVAEDNEINKRILVRQLQASGHEVVAANDGREALEKLMDPEGMEFDCCLMDVEMPHISGVEATKAIRLAEKGKGKGSRRLRIVGCTGNAREGQIKSALEAGMDTIVTKPYRISHLLEAVAGDSKHDDSQMDSSA